ncbi:hypothetical protein CK226_19865 [Mesorhizobium sp. WSM4311]|nr:hypothetical protein CK226_19865 [Mesorhizobium sp. WSM4311]
MRFRRETRAPRPYRFGRRLTREGAWSSRPAKVFGHFLLDLNKEYELSGGHLRPLPVPIKTWSNRFWASR